MTSHAESSSERTESAETDVRDADEHLVETDVTLQEWSQSGPLALTERDLSAIKNEINAGRKQIDYEYDREGRVHLKTSHYVGIFSLPDGPTVEIRPKAAGDNLLSLLRYSRGLDSSIIESETAVHEGREFLDAIAALYLDELEEVVRHGLHTSYVRVDETEEHLRGQIDVQRQIQRQGHTPTEFECTYDELTADTTANRAILYATSLLLSLVKSDDLRRGLERHQALLRRQVTLTPVEHYELNQIELTRLNEHYADILELAELVIRRIHIENLSSGEYPFFSILVNMNQIFEDVVERAVRQSLSDKEDLTVEGQASVRGLIQGGRYPVKMKPDFVVRDEQRNILVGDAKWKVGKPSQSDLYQMTAYELADDAPGLLVYPAQNGLNTTEYLVRDSFPLRLTELPTDSNVDGYEEFTQELENSISDEIEYLIEQESSV